MFIMLFMCMVMLDVQSRNAYLNG